MIFSRPAFYSALGSCLAHSVALGFAATLLVSPPQSTFQPIKVSLLQRATPLPVDDGAAGPPALIPVEKPVVMQQPVLPPPQPKPKPLVKPRPVRSAPPKLVHMPAPEVKKPQPQMEAAQPRQKSPLQLTAIQPTEGVPGPDSARSDSADSASGDENRTALARIGAANGGIKTGNGASGQSGSAAQPDYNVNPKPPYPMLARRLGAQGVVLLRVQVREDGSVAAVELARSSGFSILDESATRTVRESWRFVPARMDDSPVVSWVEVPIRFVLEDS